jgi:LAO/AO transport system kinase
VISWVENEDPRLRSVVKCLKAPAAGTRVIGLTGAPGAGKSTVTSALVRAFRARGNRVAVLAVDPSSPFTGGALLGDRVRMQEHATDAGVFIRSMGSRGQLGGLAAAAPQAIRVLAAAGYEVILVETVGVGQAEVEIASAADTTVVLVVPGMGDSIQAAKAGLLEVADVLVVNKADRPDTQATLRDLRAMVRLATGEWTPPIVPTVATSGDGVDDLLGALDKHDAWLESSGERARRRLARARDEVAALAHGALARRLAVPDELAARVADGQCAPAEAAEELLAARVLFKDLPERLRGAPDQATSRPSGLVGLRCPVCPESLACPSTRSIARRGFGSAGSGRRRRWRRSPRSCARSSCCSPNSTRSSARTGSPSPATRPWCCCRSAGRASCRCG